MAEFVLAVDPGDTQSAGVFYDVARRRPHATNFLGNDAMRGWIESLAMRTDSDAIDRDRMRKNYQDIVLAIEFTPPYTMKTKSGGAFVPRQVVDTSIEIGRMIEAWEQHAESGRYELVSRIDVKKHLLGKSNGTDQMVNAALFERYGGTIKTAKGCKSAPGPLYGFNNHLYAALAVAVTYCEKRELTPDAQ